MSKRFLLIMAGLVLLFIGVIIYSKNKGSTTDMVAVGEGSNYSIGAGTAGVTLTEFGDFQCTACRNYYPVMKQVKDKYGDQIKFQFRHFPLVQIHKNAMISHRAAEAAGRQGKFWEMHDLLYERQASWSESPNAIAIMEDYAAELGLNIDQFKSDFASESVNDTISADVKAGQALGVSSTPTFVINGKKIEDSPNDVAGFSQLIDEAIANQNKQ